MKLMYLLLTSLIVAVACTTNSDIQETVINQSFENEHTAQNSLDWMGTYTGQMPFKNGDVFEVNLEILADGHYLFNIIRDKEPKDSLKGEIEWSSDGMKITLHELQTANNQFFVGENHLISIDVNGDKTHYQLNK